MLAFRQRINTLCTATTSWEKICRVILSSMLCGDGMWMSFCDQLYISAELPSVAWDKKQQRQELMTPRTIHSNFGRASPWQWQFQFQKIMYNWWFHEAFTFTISATYVWNRQIYVRTHRQNILMLIPLTKCSSSKRSMAKKSKNVHGCFVFYHILISIKCVGYSFNSQMW